MRIGEYYKTDKSWNQIKENFKIDRDIQGVSQEVLRFKVTPPSLFKRFISWILGKEAPFTVKFSVGEQKVAVKVKSLIEVDQKLGLGEKGFAKLHDRIVAEMVGAKKLIARTSERPTAFLFMGGAASGKSTLQEKLMAGCRVETLGKHDDEAKGPAYVKIDSDLVKEHLPHYDKDNPAAVQPESTKVAQQLFAEAKKNRQHIAYLGTGSDARYYKQLIKALHKEGYVVHLIMADVAEEEAVNRANQRTRKVPEPIVRRSNQAARRNFATISKEADSWAFYDNSGEAPKLSREKKVTYQK